MPARYVSFDIEIAKQLPDVEKLREEYRQLRASGADAATLAAKQAEGERAKDWDNFRPLGVSCAATLTSDGDLRLWHGDAGGGGGRNSSYRAQMLPSECASLAQYLIDMQAGGYPVVTWNGFKFDFHTLAEECQDPELHSAIVDLALDHKDVMFALFCDKGHTLGLQAAAQGMGLPGKTAGMSGDQAPVLWAQGRASQERVLEYVAQDVRTTAELYEAILRAGRLRWVSRSGRTSVWHLDPALGVRTVCQALETPEPDTSWMTNPWSRSEFYGWTGWPSESE
jgi:hypothetical protein